MKLLSYTRKREFNFTMNFQTVFGNISSKRDFERKRENVKIFLFPFVCFCLNEVSAILRSGRNKTKSKKSKKKKDSANDETISGAIGTTADTSADVV